MKEHSCFKKVNDKLAEKNTKLELGVLYRNQLVIGTTKVDSKVRGKAALLLATFCPFCGEKLEVVRSWRSSR